ncbi:hypothetical protein ACF07T_40260, partial [Streptomyces sp. NPDC015184]|uniref:hypothetical protein n=1 Tax=Streptomyces sp. NPDC015184 TaxID=3364946 RepID=UPI0036F6F6AF
MSNWHLKHTHHRNPPAAAISLVPPTKPTSKHQKKPKSPVLGLGCVSEVDLYDALPYSGGNRLARTVRARLVI